MTYRILIVVNAEWYFLSHRLSLAKALRDLGHSVTVATAVERGSEQAIEAAGLRFIRLNLQRRSTRPWRELASVCELIRLYRQECPDLVHHITIKPVLYGSLAAKITDVPAVINTVPGLGYVFLQSGLRSVIVRRFACAAYRLAFAGAHVRVIVQNPEDRQVFLSKKVAPVDRITLIRGSGVDIRQFEASPQPSTAPPIVLLAARLLWDKGVGELVEASRQLRRDGLCFRCVVVGVPDDQNPNSIPVATLQGWQGEGLIEWWGLRDDMPDVIKQASIVALPSYYPEGVPKFLLEAAASARPIVTTNAPGCREVVRQGENGFLVPPRDPAELANAIRTLLQDDALRARMGARSREIAVAEFSEEHVLRETLAIYHELLGDRSSGS